MKTEHYALLLLAALTFGCGDDKPPPKAPDFDWIAVETGHKCASAELACAPGNCAVKVDNRCESPVTCELSIQCICRTWTGEEGEATGKSEETIPGGERSGVRAKVLCTDGEVLATLAHELRCF